MKILVIDNYDSFTFNLVQLIGSFTQDIIVKRNDKTTVNKIREMGIDKIVISPGPGKPEGSKVSLDVIKELGDHIPILGVCLGHQAIGITFGGTVTNAPTLMHGKTSTIVHDNQKVYKDIPQRFEAGRYHSLTLANEFLSDELNVTSHTDDNVIMGIRHKEFPIEGIQFHPESVLTPQGYKLIKNWIAE